MSAHVRATHPAGVVDMGKRALQVLATAAQQPLAAPPGDAPPILLGGARAARWHTPEGWPVSRTPPPLDW